MEFVSNNDKTFGIDSVLLGNIMLSVFNAMHESYEKNTYIELNCSCTNSEKPSNDYVNVLFKS